MLRSALLELKALHRVPGPWLPLALAIWTVIVWLQEPDMLRRSEVPFFWDSVGAALSVSYVLLPLAWVLGQSSSRVESILWAARDPLRIIVINTLSIVIYGFEVALVIGLLGCGLDLTGGMSDPALAGSEALGRLALLAPLASLAPGLAFLSLSAQGNTICWLVIAVSYAFLLGPGPAAEAGASTWLGDLFTAVLATGAGLLLSTALITRRIST